MTRPLSQSVKDALADAETLTRFLVVYGNPWRMQAWPLRDESLDYYDVRQAAHAAFRAVPGLRGE